MGEYRRTLGSGRLAVLQLDAGQSILLFTAGMGVVLTMNFIQWQRDQALAAVFRRRLSSPPPEMSSRQPKVSIIVAAWNEADLLARHIESVLALRYPDKEYILCAGGSDATYEIAHRYEGPGVVVLQQQQGEGKQRALRQCFERASGEIIFFTDSDCLLDDDSFERIVVPLADGEAEAATGFARPLPEQVKTSLLAAYRWAATLYNAAMQPKFVSGLLGRNAAVLRTTVEGAGALREDVPTGTDYYLAKMILRNGARILHVPESIVQSRYAVGLSHYARQQHRWLRNSVLLGRRFGASEDVRASLTASFLGLAMIVGPIVAWFVFPPALLLWLLAVIHSALSKARYFAFAALTGSLPGDRAAVGCLWAIPLTLFECYVWASVLLDYPFKERRQVW